MSKVAITGPQANIVAQADCDGIVNAPNGWPIAGGGVCSAIYVAADP